MQSSVSTVFRSGRVVASSTRVHVALAVAATTALGFAVEMMLGARHDWRIGPFRIRISDASQALKIAGVLYSFLLAAGRERPWLRRYAVFGIATTCLLGLITIARDANDIAGAGDIAVIESYTFNVLHTHLLVGPYSRFEWHHPGPIYFYFLVPFYALSGSKPSGLAAGAVALNLAALITVGWIARRRAEQPLGILMMMVVMVFTIRAHAILASAWNAHIIVLPMVTVIVLGGAVAAGCLELLPVLALFVSITAQTHVAVVPVDVAVSLSALALAASRLVLDGDPSQWLRFRRALNVSAWICVLLWAVPVFEQFAHSPGNFTKLARFFSSGEERLRLATAFGVWAHEMVAWMQPTFRIAIGLPERDSVSTTWEWIALIGVIAIAPFTITASLRDRPFATSMRAIVFTATVTALWSTTRISGGLFDHQVFWMSCIGPLLVAVLLDGLARRRVERVRVPPALPTLLFAGFAIVVWVQGVAALKQVVERSYKPFDANIAAQTIADGIEGHVRERGGRILISIDQPAWEVAAGAIVQLQKRGVPCAVERSATWMFTDVLAPTGHETETVIVSSEPTHLKQLRQPGVTTIAARRGYFADVVPLRSQSGMP